MVGGTGLIGRAVVDRLRTEGATAVVAARHAIEGLVLDARHAEAVEAGIAEVLEHYGRLDALVVAAAPSAQTLDPARHADPVQVLDAIDAKAMTFLRLANAVLPIMTEAGYGRIVGVSGYTVRHPEARRLQGREWVRGMPIAPREEGTFRCGQRGSDVAVSFSLHI